MSLFRNLISCAQNLLMHPLRSLLSTLGVFFGVVAVIAMISICEGSKKEILSQIEGLGLKNIILRKTELTEEQKLLSLLQNSHGLRLEDLYLIQTTIPTVDQVAAIKVVPANIQGTQKDLAPEILAVNESYMPVKQVFVEQGRAILERDCRFLNQVCVIGFDLAQQLGTKGRLNQNLEIGNNTFKIIGILNSRAALSEKSKAIHERDINKAILIPLGTERSFSRKIGNYDDTLSEIVIHLKDKKDIYPALSLLKRTLQMTQQKIENYQIIVPEELMQQERRTRNLMNIVLIIITALSMITGGIGIMNITLASIFERTREIGIRRAIGATKRNIILQFILETLILSLIGATLGVLCGVGLSYTIGHFARWSIDISPYSILLAFFLALAVGLLSGIYPSRKAAQMDPVAALRHF